MVGPCQRVACCEPQPDSWYRTVNTLRFDRTDDAREVQKMTSLGYDVGRLTYIPPYDGRYARPPRA